MMELCANEAGFLRVLKNSGLFLITFCSVLLTLDMTAHVLDYSRSVRSTPHE